MTQKLKYGLFGGYDVPFDKTVQLSGLFQWVNAFQQFGSGGEFFVDVCNEDLEQYDAVHVNYTPSHAEYIPNIRRALRDSSTKLLVNVDYGVIVQEMINPTIMAQQLKLADLVFHVEPFGAKKLQHFLRRKVHAIPHPVDVAGISKYCIEGQLEPPLVVGAMYHRYFRNWSVPWYATYHLKEEYGFKTALFNVEQHPREYPDLSSYFNVVKANLDYDKYLGLMTLCYAMIDLPTDFSYGRSVVDAAALGVPVIGSNRVFASQIIYPELMVVPEDTIWTEQNLKMLLDNPDFAAKMSRQGMERAKFFDLEHSYTRMIEAIEEESSKEGAV